MRLSRVLVAAVALVLVVGLAAGFVTGAFAEVGRSALYATGVYRDGGASTLPPGTFESPAEPSRTPSPAAGAPAPAGLAPVLAAATPGPAPNGARVSRMIAGVDRGAVGESFGGAVADVGTGVMLYRHHADTGYIPASTTKLLTTTAALSLLGPDHVFRTTVVASGRSGIVLLGGGDPYLAKRPRPGRASIADLAAKTAAALQRSGRRTVTLGYDAGLFSGPAWNATWPGVYHDQVSPISALWADEGRVSGGSPGPRVADPAADAAGAFAAALKSRGIKVTRIRPAKAPAGAAVVASVSSMPLERIVEYVLTASDNDAAEVLFRQAALGAGQPGSFEGGRRAVQARLTALGVWERSVRIYDGSGLSRQTRVPAETMVRLLRLAMEGKHPELRGVVTGLPVAGVEGSLANQYGDDTTRYARGLVRAKTGTLSNVHSLAGYVRTADGSMIVYAFLVNSTSEWDALVWLQKVTTALAKCGCRG